MQLHATPDGQSASTDAGELWRWKCRRRRANQLDHEHVFISTDRGVLRRRGIKFSRATGNLAHRCCKVGFDRFLGHDEDKVVGGQDMNEPRSVFFPVYFDLYAVIAAGENVHRNHRNERSEFGVGLQGKLLRQKA